MKRPNILFLMSDEHRFDVCGFGGNAVARTPNLDRLARNAVVFDNAYTPSPICVPGRQCLASGQLPRTNRCEDFWSDLPAGSMTFSRQLARYGYETVCVGKLHHHGYDQMQGWTKRYAPDAEIAPRYVPDLIPEEAQASKPQPGVGKWSNQKEIERAGIGRGPYQEFDDEVVSATKRFIRKYFLDPMYDRPGHQPLLLKVSLLEPHYPFFAEADLFEHYLNRVPVYEKEIFDHPVLSLSQQGKPVDANPRDLRRATAAYYAMCESMDRRLGEVVQALEHAGQNLDEWLIVYTSDHGEMLGHHGIWEKTRFFEGSARVPLFLRYPTVWPARRVPENVNLCDLFATFCDVAGVPTPAGLDSRSLVPLCGGVTSPWNNESVSQMHRDHLMIKRGSLKYQYYGEDIPEVLFDLEADPGETRNFISEPRLAGAVAAFRKRRAELGHGPDAKADYRNAGYGA